MPEYVGGEEAMLQFFKDNSSYSFTKERNQMKFVSLHFVVGKDGKVYQPKVLVGSSKEIEEEGVRLILLTHWEPGISKGKKVNVMKSYLLNFK